MITKTKSITHPLKDLNLDNPVKLILLAECLKVNNCSEHFFNKVEKFFWKTPSQQLRVMCRVVFYACKSKHVPKKKVRDFVVKVIDFIGQQILSYGDLVAASEMVWLTRKMLNDGSDLSSVVMDHFSIKNLNESMYNSSPKLPKSEIDAIEPSNHLIMSSAKLNSRNDRISSLMRPKRKSMLKVPTQKKRKNSILKNDDDDPKENELSDTTENDDDSELDSNKQSRNQSDHNNDDDDDDDQPDFSIPQLVDIKKYNYAEWKNLDKNYTLQNLYSRMTKTPSESSPSPSPKSSKTRSKK